MVIPIPPIITKELFEKKQTGETHKIKVLRDAITRVQRRACCVVGLPSVPPVAKRCTCGMAILLVPKMKAPTIITIADIRNSRGVVSVQVVALLSISLIAVLQSTSWSLSVTLQLSRRRYDNYKLRTQHRNSSNESLKTSMQFCVNRRHFGTTLRQRCAKKRSANEPSRF